MNATASGKDFETYITRLGRALRVLPAEEAEDILREIRGLLADSPSDVDRRALLARLGPPERLAASYALGHELDRALVRPGFRNVWSALWQAASRLTAGFVGALACFLLYLVGFALVVTALLKPIFPHNVGIFLTPEGRFISAGASFPAPLDAQVAGGYWVTPLFGFLGMLLLLGAQKVSTAWLRRMRARLAPPTGRL